jgi:8-oxo-dGTP pyrophosphatase MutT (NUDIX family)
MTRAAGVLLVAPTGRVLLMERRDGRWGIPGGKAEPEDRSLEETALRELQEETGYTGKVALEPAELYRSRTANGDEYWTFGGKVPSEFRVTLNAEHRSAAWYDEPPEPLHPGVRAVLDVLGFERPK